MGKIMKRLFKFLLAALMLVLVIYLLLRGLSSFHHGYSWEEMDWNSDGKTAIVEFFEASDIGRREVLVDSKACVEYFAYKDGLAVRIDCPNDKEQPLLKNWNSLFR